MRVLKKIAIICLVLGLVGCNTMNGVGQDLKAGGNALSKSAQKHGA